jgi:hypothetical protein
MGLEQYFGKVPSQKSPLMEAHRTEAVSRLRRDLVSVDPLQLVTVTLQAGGKDIGTISERSFWWQNQLEQAVYKSSSNELLNRNFDTYKIDKLAQR